MGLASVSSFTLRLTNAAGLSPCMFSWQLVTKRCSNHTAMLMRNGTVEGMRSLPFDTQKAFSARDLSSAESAI